MNKNSPRPRTTLHRTLPIPAMATETSAWTDPVWTHSNPTAGQNSRMYWKFALADGSWSTDPQHSYLLQSFRLLLWLLLNDKSGSSKNFKTGSVAILSPGIRDLFRWMVHRKLRNFRELTARLSNEFYADLPMLVVDGPSFFGGASALELAAMYHSDVPEKDDVENGNEIGDGDLEEDETTEDSEISAVIKRGPYSYNQLTFRLSIWEYVYQLHSVLLNYGFEGMAEAPFDGRKISKLAGKLAADVRHRIPPLPDEVALPLLASALEWIGFKADDVISLQTRYLQFIEREVNQGRSTRMAAEDARADLQNFVFSSRPGERRAWRKRLLEPEKRVDKFGEEVSLNPIQQLRHAILRVKEACTAILAYFVGLRAHEMCSFESGHNVVTGLPSCIVIRKTKSATMELFYVRGKEGKKKGEPKETEWLIGCRPVGSSFVPPPVRALTVLQTLLEPWRTLGNRKELIISFRTPKALPTIAAAVSRVTSMSLNAGLRHFFRYEVDLGSLPDTSKSGEDLVRYRESRGQCVRVHQGRKTFAAYILLARRSLLPAVSQHFKHLSTAVTENAYFPQDMQMRESIDDVARSETVNYMFQAINGEPLVGKMAELVKKYFSGSEWQNQTETELRAKLKDLVNTHDIRIFFEEHGNCWIRVNPCASRCHEAVGNAGWNVDEPYYANRTPGMCGGCGAFVTDRSHAVFWEERYKHNSEILKTNTDGVRRGEFRVIAARADQSLKMLKYLRGGTGS
jgi:hypothetical protein